MSELKPCPFCGGKAEIVEVTRHVTNNRIVVKCSRCGASTRTFSDNKSEYAIDAWERRATDE